MASQEEVSFNERCRQLIQELERASKLHAREVEKEIDRIQREAVSLRDDLIDRVRRLHSKSALQHLERVNVALSFLVMVEYPVTTLQRAGLEQARDTLKKIVSASANVGHEALR